MMSSMRKFLPWIQKASDGNQKKCIHRPHEGQETWRHSRRVEHSMFQSTNRLATPVVLRKLHCRWPLLIDGYATFKGSHSNATQVREAVVSASRFSNAAFHLSEHGFQVRALAEGRVPCQGCIPNLTVESEFVLFAYQEKLPVALECGVKAVTVQPCSCCRRGLHSTHNIPLTLSIS